MECGIWNKFIWVFMRDYVRPLYLLIDKGSVLYKAMGSKLGIVIFIIFLVINSVPPITQLDINTYTLQ